jgi:hypothetical protein
MDARWKPLPPPPPVADDVAWRAALWHVLVSLPLAAFVSLALAGPDPDPGRAPAFDLLRAAVPVAWVLTGVVIWGLGGGQTTEGDDRVVRVAAVAGTAVPVVATVLSGWVAHLYDAHGNQQWSPAAAVLFAALAAAPGVAYVVGRDGEGRGVRGPAVVLALELLLGWFWFTAWAGSIYTGD